MMAEDGEEDADAEGEDEVDIDWQTVADDKVLASAAGDFSEDVGQDKADDVGGEDPEDVAEDPLEQVDEQDREDLEAVDVPLEEEGNALDDGSVAEDYERQVPLPSTPPAAPRTPSPVREATDDKDPGDDWFAEADSGEVAANGHTEPASTNTGHRKNGRTSARSTEDEKIAKRHKPAPDANDGELDVLADGDQSTELEEAADAEAAPPEDNGEVEDLPTWEEEEADEPCESVKG